MSTVKTNNVQVGQSVTATNNGTWYQPSTPDGTIRYGIGNAGATTSDVVTLTSAGNVGIGTNSPATKLHVSGTGSTPTLFERTGSNGVYLQLKDASGSSVFLGASNGVFAIQTPGSSYSDKLVVDSSGNLGLGVTPSGWYSTLKAIQVGGTASVSHLNAGTGNQQANYGNNFYYNTSGVETYIQSTGAQRYRQLSGAGHIWEIAPSGTAGNAISFTQAMTLDASGNLLVGTTGSNAGSGGLKIGGPVSIAGAAGFTGNYTVSASDTWLTGYALTGTVTITLPTPSTNVGRFLFIRTQSNFAINSASSNVTTLAGGAATTSILSATAGKWAILFCDGSYWNIFAAN